jgi:hypothetical protein
MELLGAVVSPKTKKKQKQAGNALQKQEFNRSYTHPC